MDKWFHVILVNVVPIGLLTAYLLFRRERLFQNYQERIRILPGLVISTIFAYFLSHTPDIPFYLVGGLVISALGYVESGMVVTAFFVLIHTFAENGTPAMLSYSLIQAVFMAFFAGWFSCKKTRIPAMISIAAGTVILVLAEYGFVFSKESVKELLWQVTGAVAISCIVLMILAIKKEENYSYDSSLFAALELKNPKVYKHSCRVAKLSFDAAEWIGADAEFAEAIGKYHEIGRLVNPKEYIQAGKSLMEKEKLPETLIEAVGQVSGKSDKPKTREAAIVFLSENILTTLQFLEAKKEHVAIHKVVESVFSVRLMKGVFEDSGLSLTDYVKLKQFYLKEMEDSYDNSY